MADMFRFEKRDNQVFVKNGRERIALDAEKLEKAQAKKSEINKLALMLYKADKRDCFAHPENQYAFYILMRDAIEAELNKLDPVTGWQPFSFLIDRGSSAENSKPSAMYYVCLMALEYLGLFESFFEAHQDDFQKLQKNHKVNIRAYNSYLKNLHNSSNY